jgi:hypothetical protein
VPSGHSTLTVYDVAVMPYGISGRTTFGVLPVGNIGDSELRTITSGSILTPDTEYRLEFVLKTHQVKYSQINKITFTTKQ